MLHFCKATVAVNVFLYYSIINLLFKISQQSINAYLAVIVRKYNGQNTTTAAFIDSFAMTAMWNRRTPRLKVCIGIKDLIDVLIRLISNSHCIKTI